MANGWTSERRARQAQLIRTWRPWERSTGPRTATGKATSARNGLKGGLEAEVRSCLKESRALLKEHREALKKVNSLVGQ